MTSGARAMDSFSWIMSHGGPLICVESSYASSWGGNVRLTVAKENAASDHERPGYEPTFLQSIPLQKGFAIIIMEGVHDTSFWRRHKDKKLFIVQIACCDEGIDVESILENLDDAIFLNPNEVLEFDFISSKIEMFDSAEEGTDSEKKIINTLILPGKYRILSKMYDPNEQISFVLHRFDEIA